MSDLANVHDHWRGLEITGLEWGEGEYLGVSQAHVLSIKPYSEPAEMGMTIWFEVTIRHGNGPVRYMRVNGAQIRHVSFQEGLTQ